MQKINRCWFFFFKANRLWLHFPTEIYIAINQKMASQLDGRPAHNYTLFSAIQTCIWCSKTMTNNGMSFIIYEWMNELLLIYVIQSIPHNCWTQSNMILNISISSAHIPSTWMAFDVNSYSQLESYIVILLNGSLQL